METHEFAKKRFGLSWSTFLFIVMCFVTLGYTLYIWMWNFTNRVSSPHTRGANRTFLVLILAFLAWETAFGDSISDVDDLGLLLIIGLITLCLALAATVLIIILSFRTKTELERVLAEAGLPMEINGILCFILPFFYQYYVVYNAEERFRNQQMLRQAYAQVPGAPQPGAPQQRPAPSNQSAPSGNVNLDK